MGYIKTAWTELVAITAARLNNLETQYDEAKTDIDAHTVLVNNPHAVTVTQVGAVAKTGDTMTGDLTVPNILSSSKVLNLTLLSASWVNNTAISGYWEYTVADAQVGSSTIVNFAIHLTSLDNASDMINTTQSFAGNYKFYATAKPILNIVVDVTKTGW